MFSYLFYRFYRIWSRSQPRAKHHWCFFKSPTCSECCQTLPSHTTDRRFWLLRDWRSLYRKRQCILGNLWEWEL